MHKPIIAALAALTVAGATVATTVPASAEGWHGGGWHGGGWRGGGRGHDFDAGPAIFAGVAGLALGAALASDHPRYYDYPPPAYGYPGPYYGRPYATCYSRERVWDPYYGDYTVRSVPYAC